MKNIKVFGYGDEYLGELEDLSKEELIELNIYITELIEKKQI